MISLTKWINDHTINIIIGIIVAILGYFAPITGVVSVVSASIIIDLIVGVWAARKRNEPIESNKLWKTIKKWALSIILISLLFACDTEFGIVQLHRLAAFFITGFEIWSIIESMAYVVDHPAFYALRDVVKDKLEKNLNTDLDEE